jgi:hypothetical protein
VDWKQLSGSVASCDCPPHGFVHWPSAFFQSAKPDSNDKALDVFAYAR